ncbi:MAG: hypothetical protein PW792_07805 [Acidobacteriaceae bacterium]|nr:hypothetical protein [Acidobacteriaceae bacterium]
MRKLIAIALLAIFSLPFATSLLAMTPKSEANLPACCRRSGAHHCMMSMAERSQMLSNKPQFSALQGKCPYCPANIVIGHQPSVLATLSAQPVFLRFISRDEVIAHAESNRRISRERSRYKRGPPSSLLSNIS